MPLTMNQVTNNTLIIKGRTLTFDTQFYPNDIEKVRKLTSEVGVFSDEEIYVSGEMVEDALKDSEYCSFIFLRDAEQNLVAYTSFGEIPFTNKRFDLYWIAVAKEWQNQKLASLILARTENEIRKLGGKKIYAETSGTESYQAARNFYLKSGFTKVAEIADYYKDGDNKVLFVKELD